VLADFGMAEEVGGFSSSHERWLRAQEAVVEFERVIFRDGHPLTEGELSRLQDLRRTAAECLGELVDTIGAEYGRLCPPPDGGAAERPAF